MANGQTIFQRNDAIQITMLDAVTASSLGQWVDVIAFNEGVVQVSGITTATVNVRGYNIGTAVPANSVTGYVMGANVTASGDNVVMIGAGAGTGAAGQMPRFLKVDCSAYTGGTITAALVARNSHG